MAPSGGSPISRTRAVARARGFAVLGAAFLAGLRAGLLGGLVVFFLAAMGVSVVSGSDALSTALVFCLQGAAASRKFCARRALRMTRAHRNNSPAPAVDG